MKGLETKQNAVGVADLTVLLPVFGCATPVIPCACQCERRVHAPDGGELRRVPRKMFPRVTHLYLGAAVHDRGDRPCRETRWFLLPRLCQLQGGCGGCWCGMSFVGVYL